MSDLTSYVYTPFYKIAVLAAAARTAVVDALSTPVRTTGYSDEWVMVINVDAIAGTLVTTLQESLDYDPSVHAAPTDAHWYDTVQIGTSTGPITAIGQKGYAEYHFAPLGRYVRLKYTITGTVTFGCDVQSKAGRVDLDG